jgi:Short C-terminal domain
MVQRNLNAAGVALELLAWDKNRISPLPGPEGREGLIARGADCYGRLIYSLHGEGGGDPDADCEEWLRESAAMRLQRPDMNKKGFLSRKTGSPNLSDHDMAQLDRKHPERSFSAQLEAVTAVDASPADERAAADEDLVERLERLRALHDDGVLTDDEFAAAKTRLLG